MDKLKPGTKAWHDRQRRHRHNGFSGSAKMMEIQLQSMIDYDSVSPEAKFLAKKIQRDVHLLQTALKTRID